MDTNSEKYSPESKRRPSSVVLYTSIAFFVCITSLFYALCIKAPNSFTQDSLILVEEGETVNGIVRKFDTDGFIKSETIFKSLLILFGGTKGLVAGDYALTHPENAIVLAWRLSHGSYNVDSVRITVPEGLNVKEVAALFEKKLYRFDEAEFIRISTPFEGYLFPDTYLFLPNATASEVMKTMTNRFNEKISELEAVLVKFKRPLGDVIKMASIIEEEARTEMTRQMIAGILWKRLDTGMPLQVDAAFQYVNGEKDSTMLSLDDLKIDSPYNTYTNKGLPPTPIANPGLAAIKATVSPISSPYYFYLSDKQGEMHYGRTHEEHLVNKEKYL